jgi:hypothetical protein
MSSGRPTRPSAVMSATRLLISGLSRTIPPLKSVAMDGYRQKAFLMTKIDGRTRLLVEATGVELFWVLTTRYLLIQEPPQRLEGHHCPIHCTFIVRKYLSPLESDRQTVQSRVHANSALSTSRLQWCSLDGGRLKARCH